TAAGYIFLEEARAVLARADLAVQTVRNATAAKKQELHIGYAPSPTSDFLSCILHSFQQQAPKVSVVLHDMTSAEMTAALLEKKIQAALIVGHPWIRIRGMTFEPLRRYRVGVIVPRTHPLARTKTLPLGALFKEQIVAFSKKEYSDYYRWLQKILGPDARKLQVAEEYDGALSLIAAVEAGRGIAISAESMMFLAGTRISFVPFKPAPPPLEVGICYLTGKTSAITRTFIEAARSTADL
ncbi:MAG: LysR family substrate-binding domain-containing protein, partial [Limisphaerales bacterium]